MPSDQQALLRAILERPDDDTPRLVFADWLEEHGNPERAEFIRAQCRLATSDPTDPDFDELTERERTLWRTHREEWVAAFARWSEELVFARGFPFRATLTAERFAEIGQDMLRLSTVREARLLEVGRSAHRLSSCAALGGLEGLELAADGLSTQAIDGLFGSRQWARLRRLRVQVPAGRMRAFAWSPGLRGLQQLDISGSRLYDRDFRDLGRSRYLTALTAFIGRDAGLTAPDLIDLCRGPVFDKVTHLDLTGNPLDTHAVHALGRMPKAGPFRVLHLSPEDGARFNPADLYYLFASGHTSGLLDLALRGADLGEAGAKEVAWAGLADLRRLDLAQNGIGPEGAGHLSRAANPWRLSCLNLSGNRLGDAGAQFLARTRFEQLRHLVLRDNGLGDAGFRALVAAEWAGALSLLDVCGNGSISDASAGVIATATHLTGLRVLRLSGTAVGQAGAQLLASSPHLGRLRELNLSGCRVGDGGQRALQARFGQRVIV